MLRPLLFLFVAIVPSWWTFSPAQAADTRPNVLFLFTDDQRADTIAALGNPHIRTPNLDRLAREGFAFTNAYCMGGTVPAVCLPSRTMLHSGRSLFHLQNVENGPHLGKSLREAGYETWSLSKRGNTPHALHKSFEHSDFLKDQEERAGGYTGRTEADRAIEFLKNRTSERPFFMLLAFAGPHDPRGTNAEFRALYDVENMPLPANYRPFHPFDNGELLVRDERLETWPRSEAAIRRHLFDYYAVISHIDYQIGRIFQTLDDLGQWDNTIVIFSSDHGLAIGSHGLMGKQNVYEDGMKSPLLFRGPGIRDGTSGAYAYLFDIYPTICELIGAPIPPEVEGKSLAPILHGDQERVRDTLFLAYRHVQRAVRRGEWKLIRYPQVDVTQLFNLSDDPYEMHSLADDPRYADKMAEMMELLKAEQVKWDDSQPLTVANPGPAAVDLETFFPKDSP